MPKIKYPAAAASDHVDVIHGTPVRDPYRWMEEIDSPEVGKWIEEENALTRSILDASPARTRIRARMEELWDYEKYGTPVEEGGRLFYTRNDGLQNQSVLYVQDAGGEPRVLLDPNTLSEDGTLALTGAHVSHDGRLLAYGVSQSGSDWQEWRIRDVGTGRDLSDHLRWTKFTRAVWTRDNRGFYYTRNDEPKQGQDLREANYYQKLYYHQVGDPQSRDELVYHRTDQPEWRFSPAVTEDGAYLLVTVTRGTYPETMVLIRAAGGGGLRELIPGLKNRHIFVGGEGRRLLFMSDEDAPMGRVVTVDAETGERRVLVPETGDNLEDASWVGGRLLLTYLRDAHSLVRVHGLDGAPQGELKLPGLGTVAGFEGSQDAAETHYSYTGFSTPGTIYRLDTRSLKSTVFKTPKLRFSPLDYVTEQVFARSRDGTRVPVFLTYRRGLRRPAPVLLTGYGGFNISVTPQFSVRNLVWMEMGGVHASANLRGGREYGRGWHEQGIKTRKQNVFDDFIAAAEHLIAEGWTTKELLAIAGRSNGGLLVGACLLQRPDLYAAAIPAVGVMDMLRFEKFTVGWGWRSDYGTVEDPDEFRALLAYSPLHNAKRREYPPTLVTTADHDDRVYPAHSFKFAAALQAAQTGEAPVLARIDSKAGHGGGKPTGKLIDEYTDELGFLAIYLKLKV